MIRYWNNLITNNTNKYSNTIYKIMLQSDFSFKWLEAVRNILNKTGNTHLFLNQSHIVTNNIHLIIKQVLTDQFITEWNCKLQASNKGKLYYLFKQEHKRENYLTLLPRHLYLPLIKFRTANHRLPVHAV